MHVLNQTKPNQTKRRHLELEASTTAISGMDYNLEYRSKADDAWYTCAVVLEHGNHHLRVKFKDFVQSHFDEVFTIADFSTHCEIQQLLLRCRPLSKPIDDNECSNLVQGMAVNALYTRPEDARYFDAIVDAVQYKEHTLDKCLCTYFLCWQHGPGEGTISAASIEDICFILDGDIHPKVSEFTDLVRQKLRGALVQSQVLGSVGHSSLVESSAGRERLCYELSDHDEDMGGAIITDRHYYILLENLDKDLCPLLMMEFIREHTSITAQTCVFPSLFGEIYARGAIMVDSSTKLKRIYDFVNDPNHLITSFSGRPWIMAEENLRNGTFNTNLQNLQPKHENYKAQAELKVVRLGTEDFRKSQQLKDLYLVYHNHMKGLMQRLAIEEKKNEDQFSFCKL